MRVHKTPEQVEEAVSIDHGFIAMVRFVHQQLIEMVRDCLAKSQDRLKILLRELQLGEVSAARQVFKYFFSIKIFFYSKVFLDPSQVCRDCGPRSSSSC